MKLERLGSQHAEPYRRIRLEALQKNPEAFGSSYQEEKDKTIEDFENRIQSKNVFTIGAFEGENLIGIVNLVTETKLKLKHRASIFAMYVQEDYRGSGTGRKLMEEAISLAKTQSGIEQIYLTVVTGNMAAKGLYTSLGFVVYGEDKRALKIGNTYYDEEHMVLFI
ncbi:ribosomal protein S18 acetylase RimI-like enzyme [Peribacillus deserti]|uniref:Ribosomal protein S18 acetylase RimI-like enzyme n=1 Tax=Peribacillus deserti TaxID=673318 RepID=A0ABS2QDB7_9BACI|nr:GNAT family N-acetyltransferase [Peribacillus deserti]MBM7691162.1 ribosomal protein S18 acetylase RimI-like enzyme [Peribacillus deserti]